MAFGRLKKNKTNDDAARSEPAGPGAVAPEVAGTDADVREAAGTDADVREAAGTDADVREAAGTDADVREAAGTDAEMQDDDARGADTNGTADSTGGAAPGGAGKAVTPKETVDRSAGPFDASELDSLDGYVDLGSLLIAPHEGLALRLEVEERTQRVVAVTLDMDGSSLQLQAFAAPRSEGLWTEIRSQIGASVSAQNGTTEEVQGPFGTEVVAKLPAQAADGSKGFRAARFVGVDGPRWFLRGVFGADAALDRAAAATLEALFRAVVVVRGEHPLPPRDLLPLRVPTEATAPGMDASAEQDEVLPGRPERGPEITKIG